LQTSHQTRQKRLEHRKKLGNIQLKKY